MKGTTYSGIVHLPEHPDADMHGLIRIVCRTKTRMEFMDRICRAGVRCTGLWDSQVFQESKSHAEQLATERHYGELLACPLVMQYLGPEKYKPIPKSLLRRKTA